MKVLRNQASLKRIPEVDDPFVSASPQQCVAFVWELTAELWSLKGSPYVERRLPRNIANLIRK